ncbi:hypothetical protein [Burkholderia multivorans]|uniref:hypothetical protein n=1 Tax=Burkholderia multivorans TaxID=87883 RepID=UPI0009B90149|nr:hypothetical protein [Burkholderia multivorans]HDR9474364.1 hypothetical protein [Burkholderia multivorans]HDR9480206.1 hypothetical protein [Burkholderia multivorans]
MEPIWEYQWEYTDLDDGQVKVIPFWLTEAEAANSHTLLNNDFGRKRAHTRRQRIGEPEWRTALKGKPSGIKRLPEFETPLHAELVELYQRNRDPDVRRVILEVVRVRRVLGEIEGLVATIRQEYGDKLVAMNWLRRLVQDEKRRVGDFERSDAEKKWREASLRINDGESTDESSSR